MISITFGYKLQPLRLISMLNDIKKYYRKTLIILLIILIPAAFYFLTVTRLNSFLYVLVDSQSEGKLSLSIGDTRFNFNQLRFDFSNIEIRTTDTTGLENAYKVKAEHLFLDFSSLTAIYFGKHLYIDSVVVIKPVIELTKVRQEQSQKVSLSDEMNLLYQKLEAILDVLNLYYLRIEDAGFLIQNNSDSESNPLEVKHIHLKIDKVTKDGLQADENFLYADDITLEIFDADIHLPGKGQNIRFKKLYAGSQTRELKIDSCVVELLSTDSAASTFLLSFDQFRVDEFDFNAFARTNHLNCDSAYCTNLDLDLKLLLNKKGDSAIIPDTSTFDEKFSRLFNAINIQHLVFFDASVDLAAGKPDKLNRFSIEHSHATIKGVVFGNENQELGVESLSFGLNNNRLITADSSLIITFSELGIENNSLSLIDFKMVPFKEDKPFPIRSLTMPVFRLDSVIWLELLLANRFRASHALFDHPKMKLSFREVQNTEKKDSILILPVLEKLKNVLDINGLTLQDGVIHANLPANQQITIDGISFRLNPNRVLNAQNELDMLNGLDDVRLNSLTASLNDKKFRARSGTFKRESALIRLKKLEFENDKGTSVELTDLKIKGLRIRSLAYLSMNSLDCENGKVRIMGADPASEPRKIKAKKSEGLLEIDQLGINELDFIFQNKELYVSFLLNNTTAANLVMNAGKTPLISSIRTYGKSFKLSNGKQIELNIPDFEIIDLGKSRVGDAFLSFVGRDETLMIEFPEITFIPDVQSLLNKTPVIRNLHIYQPIFDVDHEVESESIDLITSNTEKGAGFPVVNINSILIDKPIFRHFPKALASHLVLNPGEMMLLMSGLVSDSSHIRLDSINLQMKQPSLSTEAITSNRIGEGSFEASIHQINLNKNNKNSIQWSFLLKELAINHFEFITLSKIGSGNTIQIHSLDMSNLQLYSAREGLKELIEKNTAGFKLGNAYLSFKNDRSILSIHNLGLNQSEAGFTIDSLQFQPAKKRDDFIASFPYQQSFLSIHGSNIKLKGLNLSRLLDEKLLYFRKIDLGEMELYAYKDKNLPFRHGFEKPMLSEMLMNIGFPMQVDSLILRAGEILYEEQNDKTGQLGQIRLAEFRALANNLKTNKANESDSLIFKGMAKLSDTVSLRFAYKQSYLDSLYGFHLKLIVNAFEIPVLNPILGAFASAKIVSGRLDTIRMSVVGRKYVAFGAMRMYYRNLEVEYLRKGDSTRANLFTRLISWSANKIVRKRNTTGVGEVYAERDPEKGFVNYWLKAVIGGVLTNTGVRSNKAQERKYEKAIKLHEVPPIPDIPIDYE